MLNLRNQHRMQLNKGPLDELTEEEMVMIVPISQEELDQAIERGIRDRDLIEKAGQDCRLPSPMYYR